MADLISVSLLQQAQADSESAACADFLNLHTEVVDRWLCRRGLSSQDVHNIRQEVQTVMIRELPRLRHNGRTAAFRDWLRAVTANRMRRHWREKMKRQSGPTRVQLAEMADQLEDPASALTQIWQAEYDRQVQQHLLNLVAAEFKPNTLTAFRRIVLQGESSELVADDLGMTINAVRIAQSRVLRSLRRVGQGLVD